MKKMGELQHRYSESIAGKKIAVFGPYPPPIGGISIHVQRVIAKMKNQNNNVHCFHTTAEVRRFFLLYIIKLIAFIFWFRPNEVHYHSTYLYNSLSELRVLFLLKKFIRFSVLFVEHDCRYIYKKDETFKKKISHFFKDQKIVFIGEITHRSYSRNNVALPESISVESSFLPPDKKEEKTVLSTYPKALFEFIHVANPLIVANAFQFSLLNGKDLYGCDMCLDLVKNLKKKYPNIRLVFACAQLGNVDYFKTLQQTATSFGIQNSIYFLTGNKVLWPLIKRADVFVRPTLSDSFGISVAEALSFGVPAIASDVCTRPSGTILFKTGNQEDFFKKVCGVLDKEIMCYQKKEKQKIYQRV